MELVLGLLPLEVQLQRQEQEREPELILRMLHRRIHRNHMSRHMRCKSHTMAGRLVRSRQACNRLALA